MKMLQTPTLLNWSRMLVLKIKVSDRLHELEKNSANCAMCTFKRVT